MGHWMQCEARAKQTTPSLRYTGGGALCAAVHSCLWPLEVRNSACDCDHDVLECLTRGDVAIVPRGLAQQWLLPPHLPLQWFPPRPQTR